VACGNDIINYPPLVRGKISATTQTLGPRTTDVAFERRGDQVSRLFAVSWLDCVGIWAAHPLLRCWSTRTPTWGGSPVANRIYLLDSTGYRAIVSWRRYLGETERSNTTPDAAGSAITNGCH